MPWSWLHQIVEKSVVDEALPRDRLLTDDQASRSRSP
jgi:hypothetical protein